MTIDDDHMYHGAALIQIAEHPSFTAINSLRVSAGVLQNAYCINQDVGLYLKYAGKQLIIRRNSFPRVLFEAGLPHIYDHEVSEEEVRQALAHPGEDRPSFDRSRIAIGQTAGGRYLRVIYVPDPGGDSAFVVTAYELRGQELKAYRRRRRRRGR